MSTRNDFSLVYSSDTESVSNITPEIRQQLEDAIARAIVDSAPAEQVFEAAIQNVKDGHSQVLRAAINKYGLSHVNSTYNDGLALLHAAVTGNHGDIVRYLLNECGADINLADKDGQTALHHAIISDNIDLVKQLTDLKPEELDFNVRCGRNRSVLHYAAKSGNPDIVRFVLERFSDVGSTCDQQKTVLHYAATTGSLQSVQLLLQHNSDVINVRDAYGRLPLHEAAVAGNSDVFRYLLSLTAEPLAEDVFSRNCLHEAAADGHVPVVELLCQWLSVSGKDSLTTVNAKDFWPGETPFLKAASGGHVETLKLLLKHGASLTARNNMGQSALHLATNSGRLDCVEFLLSISGADVNAQDLDGSTPLHLAVKSYRLDMVEALLGHGCQVNIQDSMGKPALFYALMTENVSDQELCDAIVEILCKRNYDVNLQDKFGNTYLHLYVSEEGAANLLKAGADVNIRNEIGMTPLHHACIRHRVDLVKLFTDPEYGADVNLQDVYGVTALHYALRQYTIDLIDWDVTSDDVENFEYVREDTAELMTRVLSRCDVTVIEALMKRGASVNIQTFVNRKTPLHVAFENCSLSEQVVSILLASDDVDLSCKDSLGVSSGSYVVFDGGSVDRVTGKEFETLEAHKFYLQQVMLVRQAVQSLHVYNPVFFFLRQLEKFKQLAESDNENRLILLEERSCLRFVPEFHCTMLKSQNPLNREFIHLLVFDHSFITKDQLEPYLAMISKEEINSRDDLGRTPLFYAILNFKLDLALLLTKLGADSKLADNDSFTPEDLVTALETTMTKNMDIDSAATAGLRNLREEWSLGASVDIAPIPESNPRIKVVKNLKDKQWKDICKTEEVEGSVEFDYSESIYQIWQTLVTLKSKAYYADVIRNEVTRFIEKLVSEISKMDNRLTSTAVMVGSTYEGTRTDFPEEFDFNLKLVELERICEYDEVPDYHPGFIQIKSRSDCSCDDYKEFFNASGYLQTQILKDKLSAVITKILRQPVMWQDGTFECLSYSVTSGRMVPAITLKLHVNRLLERQTGNLFIFGESNERKTAICIDLAPVIKVDLDNRKHTFVFPIREDFFAVCTLRSPKDHFTADTLGICSVSFVMVEKETIRNSPAVVKAGFMVAKRLAEQFYSSITFGTNIIKYSVLNCLFRKKFSDRVLSSTTVEPEVLIDCVGSIFAEIRRYALDDAVPSPFIEGHYYPFWFRDCAAGTWPAYFRRYGLDMRSLVNRYAEIHAYVFSARSDVDFCRCPDPLAGYLFGYMLQTLSVTL